jgi:hypothetical protein
LLLSLCIVFPQNPQAGADVSLADLAAFPSQKEAEFCHRLAWNFEQWIRSLGIPYHKQRPTPGTPAYWRQRETTRAISHWRFKQSGRRGLWQMLRNAWALPPEIAKGKSPEQILEIRLGELRLLRDAIGKEAYQKGRMPCPLTWWMPADERPKAPAAPARPETPAEMAARLRAMQQRQRAHEERLMRDGLSSRRMWTPRPEEFAQASREVDALFRSGVLRGLSVCGGFGRAYVRYTREDYLARPSWERHNTARAFYLVLFGPEHAGKQHTAITVYGKDGEWVYWAVPPPFISHVHPAPPK